MLDELLQESCKNVLYSTFLNDNVSGHAMSENGKSRNNLINYSPKNAKEFNYSPKNTTGTEVQNEVTVETVEEHDNKAVMVAPHLSELITEEEAFVLCQVFNKTDRLTSSKSARLAPILFVHICTGLGKPQPRDARVLLDLGASSSIISYELVHNLRLKECTKSTWATAAGTLGTNQKAKVEFMFPELSETKIITWKLHIFKNTLKYNLIIGRDLLQALGILLDFKNQTITWDEITIPMKDPEASMEEGYEIHESLVLYEATERTKQILEAKYEAVTPQQIVDGCVHLKEEEKEKLLLLLEKFKRPL